MTKKPKKTLLERLRRIYSEEGVVGVLARFWGSLVRLFFEPNMETHPSNQSVQSKSPADEMVIPIQNYTILVYQMGRVGSKSIEYSLSQYYPPKQIIHGHYLNMFNELENRVQIDLANTTNFMADLMMVDERIQSEIRVLSRHQKLKIVSLVRDPVERNISTFFFALNEFIPDWSSKYSNNEISIDVLHSIFESKKSFPLSAFNWFDEQMKPVFGIDVYSTPFPKDIGYKIYSSANVELLLFRLEDLNERAKEGFEEFLGIKNFNLIKANTSEERKTGDLYRQFKSRPLSLPYVKWTYNTKLAYHFYSETELDAFTRKWTTAMAP